jgi:glucokinase
VHITEEATMDAVLMDVTAKIIAKASMKKLNEEFGAMLEKVVALVKEVIKKSGVDKKKIYNIGLGIGGVLDRYKGTVRVPVESGPVIDYFAIQEKLEREFGISSIVENDANAAALGERWAGLGLEAGIENMLYICSDSGAGLIIKGELYPGSSSVAGELNLNPPVGQDERKPCWATYDYGCCLRSRGIDLGIASRAQLYFSEHKDAKSKILDLVKGDIEKIALSTVIEASKTGDKLAIEFIEDAGDYLGTKVAHLVNIFNPDIIVIGRGIERCGETLLNAMRRAIDRWAFKEALKVAKIVPTSLGENSIALGAAALAMQVVFVEMF